jgi:archaellum biogenesis ATPase FlaH
VQQLCLGILALDCSTNLQATSYSIIQAYIIFVTQNPALTAQQLVVLSDQELEKLLEVGSIGQLYQNTNPTASLNDYKTFLKESARQLWLAACRVSSPIQLSNLASALQNESHTPKPTFRDQVLDERIGPCFLSRGIIDVVGEASCGKTQFCLQLLLNCVLPIDLGGLGKGALYIHTEGDFPVKRWEQLKAYRTSITPSKSLGESQWESNLVLERASSQEAMENILARIRPILRAKSCALVIIDSIAALVREVPKDKRNDVLYHWVSFLQETSDDIGIPIITTNQVVDHFEDIPGSPSAVHPRSSLGLAKRHSSFLATGRRVLPALGLRWSELVNARLALTRTSQQYDGPVKLSKAPEPQDELGWNIKDMEPSAKRRMIYESPSGDDATDSSQVSSATTSGRTRNSQVPIVTPQSWEDAKVVIRQMQVLFSPVVCDLQVEYFIDAAGLHGIP